MNSNIKKSEMPIEHLRSLKNTKYSTIGCFKYAPMSIHTLLRTIPMPWEDKKICKILYHINGNISFILDKPKISKYDFMKNWEDFNKQIKKYKETNPYYKIFTFPIHGDEEEIFYQGNYLDDFVKSFNKNNDNEKVRIIKKQKFNFYDISLYKNTFPFNLHNLEKNRIKNLKKPKCHKSPTDILKHLKNTRFFQITNIEWLEAAIIILNQGHKMLSEILRRKKLYFMCLDKNFNLKPVRPLKTKERKKSRVGTSFHLTRELYKLIKYIVDIFLSVSNKYELCLNLHNLFTKIGTITGIYRYKYKVMTQIKICKDIEKVLKYYDDYSWSEIWRRYVFMTRGYNSLLKKYISNLTERIINGREYHEKKVTKQRIESNYDINIKNNMINEMEGKYTKNQIKMILRHFNEAWRYWKADHIYKFMNIEEEYNNLIISNINDIIKKYINIKSQWYIKQAIEGKVESKKDFVKKIGKLTRLFFKEERYRQKKYLKNLLITPLEAAGIYKTAYNYFKDKKNISFPETNCEKHLQNAVHYLIKNAKDEEKEFYEKVLKNSSAYIFQIKKNILTQKKFRDVEAKISHSYNEYIVIYKVNYIERLTDAFIASYIFYETSEIFPEYIKPGDEIESKSLYGVVDKLKHFKNVYLIEGEYIDLMKNIDNNLLARLLKIFIDPLLVDYIISRNNIKIYYKDMSYTNHLGFLNGFQFSSFIHKFYTFVIDLVVFGENVFIRNFNKFYILHSSECKILNENDLKYEYMTRLPKNIGKIKCINISYWDNFKFTYAGVDINICKGNVFFNLNDNTLEILKFRIQQIIKLSGSSTFIKTINKWNNTILGFITRYREFIGNSSEIDKLFTWAEKSIQLLIKKGLNSKMPARFPAVLFYTSINYGGLGMYSVMKTYCEEKIQNEENILNIPDLRNYIISWKEEFNESKRVWLEFKKSEKIELNKGVPRMSTLLQKDKITLFDRDWRLQNIYRKYISSKYDPYNFISLRHDGKLWDLSKYNEDMLDALGGTGHILKHTLYQATYAKEFSKLFWNESIKHSHMTKAQKSGLNQIPNRRFTLWWSPTINTTDVYVGYQVQLESTGIFMHGKLPTLKVSFIQIFRNNLWMKIHESLVSDLKNNLKNYCDCEIQKIFNKKSITFNKSCTDLLLIGNFYVLSPNNENIVNIKVLWIDVQLRWGSFTKHNSNKYAKVKYIEYITSGFYPDEYGLVIVFDLCYNTVGFYGYLDSKLMLSDILDKILKNNLSLHILRERLRKTLEIYTSEVEVVVSSKEMYYNTLIVEERLLYHRNFIIILDPESGNLYIKFVEGNKNRIKKNLAGEILLELSRTLKKENILIRKDMYDGIEGFMIDYKEIKIKIYENNIKMENILKLINQDIKKDIVINLYKNWFGLTSFTKFCRLILLVQAYDVLNDISFFTILSDAEWIKVEKECKEFIITEYCSKNIINKHKLLTSDIRDIVFGFETENKVIYSECTWEDKYFLMDEYLKKKKYLDIKNIEYKDDVIDNNSLLYNTFIDSNNIIDNNLINNNYLIDNNLIDNNIIDNNIIDNNLISNKSINNNIIDYNNLNNTKADIEIPKNIIRIFKRVTNINTISFAFLILDSNVISLLFVPQFATELEIHSCNNIPKFNIIGLITNTNNTKIIEPLIKKYNLSNPLVIDVTDNKPYKLTKREGYSYTPHKWNYNLCKKSYDDNIIFTVELGIPDEFYSGNNYIDFNK